MAWDVFSPLCQEPCLNLPSSQKQSGCNWGHCFSEIFSERNSSLEGSVCVGLTYKSHPGRHPIGGSSGIIQSSILISNCFTSFPNVLPFSDDIFIKCHFHRRFVWFFLYYYPQHCCAPSASEFFRGHRAVDPGGAAEGDWPQEEHLQAGPGGVRRPREGRERLYQAPGRMCGHPL